MAEEDEVTEGAAQFPEIPAELGVHPLLLAVLHAVVFLEGSSEDLVNRTAGGETLEYIASCLQRLSGPDLRRVQEDMRALAGYGREAKWDRGAIHFLKSFLADYGVGPPSPP